MLEAAGIVESVSDHRGHSVARRILLMLLGQDASALLRKTFPKREDCWVSDCFYTLEPNDSWIANGGEDCAMQSFDIILV